MNNVIDQKSIPVIEAILQNEELMHDLSETTTPEEVVNAFSKHEIAISSEMAEEAFKNAHDEAFLDSIVVEERELQEEELETVTGGGAALVLGSIGLIYVGGCAVAFILGSAYESKLGKKVRKGLKKYFG